MPAMGRDESLPTSLHLEAVAAGRVVAHCVGDYPREACGILIGFQDAGTTRRTVVDAIAVPNVWDNPDAQHMRFTIDPHRQMEIERSLEGSGRSIVGFYHSHPNAPATPSAFDLEAAWAFYSYVIASVREGRVVEMRAWMLNEAHGQFVEQTIA